MDRPVTLYPTIVTGRSTRWPSGSSLDLDSSTPDLVAPYGGRLYGR